MLNTRLLNQLLRAIIKERNYEQIQENDCGNYNGGDVGGCRARNGHIARCDKRDVNDDVTTKDGLTYESYYDGTLRLYGCDKGLTNVTIPTTVDGKGVTTICTNTFNSCTNLTSITIPNSIDILGQYEYASPSEAENCLQLHNERTRRC